MNDKGFTLIEAIASITILGLLTVLMVPAVQKSSENIKIKNYEALKKMIIAATIEYFNNSSDVRYSIDAIKTSDEDCSGDSECVMQYTLGEILDQNIYYTDQRDINGNLTIFNPINGFSMRQRNLYIYYDPETYSLKGDFIEKESN